jgi:hypothetical protein
MRPSWSYVFLCAALSTLCGPARADDVHLAGGNVIEGKVVRDEGRVTIELESGRITLSADSVERIDRRESTVEHFERAHAALKTDDVKGRMALADYCRDHGMGTRERQVLQEVIERVPDHADARSRLGFVRSKGTWITREANYRAQGMVQVDGVWLTSEKALELSRLREQTQAATRERQRAELALEAERLAMRRREQEAEQKRVANERAASAPAYIAPPIYGGYYYSSGGEARGRPSPHTQAFPINGVRDPRDTSFPINGVRDPREFLRTR